jgi:PAS domain S-box-containing protein
MAAMNTPVIEILLGPSARIQCPEHQSAARLFAGFMLLHVSSIAVFISLTNLVYRLQFGRTIWDDQDAWVVLAGTALIFLDYLILRRGYYRLAVATYIIVCTIVPLTAPFVADTDAEIGLLATSVIPILLCAIVSTPRVVFSLISLIALGGTLQLMRAPLTQAEKGTGFAILIVVVLTGILINYFRGYFTSLEESRLQALRTSEEKYRALISQSTLGITMCDETGRLAEWNPAQEQITGIARESVIGRTLWDITRDYLPQDVDREAIAKHVQSMLQQVFETGDSPIFHRSTEQRMVHTDGTVKYLKQVQYPVHSERGICIGSILEDNTERKLAEQALRDSEEQYRLLAETAQELICVIDLDGRLTYANEAAMRATGYSANEVAGLTFEQLAPPEQLEQWLELLHMRQQHLLEAQQFTTQLLTKDGRRLPVDVNNVPIVQNGVITGVLNIARDATERVAGEKAEAQLRQMQKLEAIGTLAGGIAHDFNNILFAIMANAEIALDQVDESSAVAEHLSQVMQATQRAAALVKQILTFSRRSESIQLRLNLSSIVKEVIKLLRPALPATIELQVDTSAAESQVVADAVDMHQVIMNLCSNAAQALPEEHGLIEIRVADVLLDEEYVTAHPAMRPGLYVRLSVSDTGHGMSEELRQRIFEPFFTTKNQGEGTGLGLAVVHGIINKLNGYIEVDSEPGRGTTFDVYLPALAGSTVNEEQSMKTQLPVRSGRLMVVDDEPAILHALTQILAGLGYQTQGFSSGKSALAEFIENPQDFDLLLTDMTMPQMTGADLARQVLALRPDLPVLLCTGFSHVVNAQIARDLGLAGYLMKPISRSELAQAIASALDYSMIS